jgi:hypothetical protein
MDLALLLGLYPVVKDMIEKKGPTFRKAIEDRVKKNDSSLPIEMALWQIRFVQEALLNQLIDENFINMVSGVILTNPDISVDEICQRIIAARAGGQKILNDLKTAHRSSPGL